jgi:hypothetical protein
LTDFLAKSRLQTFEVWRNRSLRQAASDAAILGESIVEEIYYRILRDEQGGTLKSLLQQRGQIQRIS